MKSKSSGVMSALKDRKQVGAKKGGFLLGIIAKLSKKRAESKDKKEGSSEKIGEGGPGKKC